MELVCFFDTKQDRNKEFVRYQVIRDGDWFMLQVLICKKFADEIATGELYMEEY